MAKQLVRNKNTASKAYQTKLCAVCGELIVRKQNDKSTAWEAKKTCSYKCAGLYRRKWNGFDA